MKEPMKIGFFQKIMKKLNAARGFSMAEIMATLAIMTILFGVAIVSGDRWIESSRQSSLDDMAEALFQAASLNLSNAFSTQSKRLDDLCDAPDGFSLTTENKLTEQNRPTGNSDSMWKLLVGNVNEELMQNEWTITYTINNNGVYYGTVNSVSVTSGTRSGSYPKSGGTDSTSNTFRPSPNTPDADPLSQSFYCWIEEPTVDDEELSVLIKAHLPENETETFYTVSEVGTKSTPKSVTFTLTLTDGTNNSVSRTIKCGYATEAISAIHTSDSYYNRYVESGKWEDGNGTLCWNEGTHTYTMRVVLDSMDGGKERPHFQNLKTDTYYGPDFEGDDNLTSGADITVSVKAQCDGEVAIQTSKRTSYTVNSLFSFRTSDDGINYIAITNERHLRNLHSATSGFGTSEADKDKSFRVLQRKDIALNIDANVPFIPIINDKIDQFAAMPSSEEGNYCTISGLTVTTPASITEGEGDNPTTTTYAGLFGTFAGSKLSHITLINPNITVDAKYAGGIAGQITTDKALTITDCSINGGTISTTGTDGAAGGIAGNINSGAQTTTLSNCSLINGKVNASNAVSTGGLVGVLSTSATGGNRIEKCGVYVTEKGSEDSLLNETENDENPLSVSDRNWITAATNAGGLVGNASGKLSITESYAATIVKATIGTEKYAGGLVGKAAELGVSNSYADCYIQGGTIGGLAGKCTAWGDITGSSFTNSYSAGFVLCGDKGDQITAAGITFDGAKIENCYSLFNFDDITTVNTINADGSYALNNSANRAGTRYAFTSSETFERVSSSAYTYRDVTTKKEDCYKSDFSNPKNSTFYNLANFPNNLGNLNKILVPSGFPEDISLYGDWLPQTEEDRVFAVLSEGDPTDGKVLLMAEENAPSDTSYILTFYYGIPLASVGSDYTLFEIADRYTGLTPTEVPDIPGWCEDKYKGNINTVKFDASFADAPAVDTSYWFSGLTNASFDFTEITSEDSEPKVKITNMSHMFDGCTSLSNFDFSKLDTSEVTDMSYMFSNCTLTSLDLSGLDTRAVTNMHGMFSNCISLTTLNLTNWDTSNVTDMCGMFSDCTRLTTITGLSVINTSKVSQMSGMFHACTSLTTLDLSGWKTSALTDMSNMFSGCSSLTSLDLSSWDTSKVTNMSGMFSNCTLTSLDLSELDTSAVTNMSDMFSGCSNLKTIYVDSTKFNTANVTKWENMFSACTALRGGNGTVCDGSNNTGTGYACIDAGETSGYFTDAMHKVYYTLIATTSDDVTSYELRLSASSFSETDETSIKFDLLDGYYSSENTIPCYDKRESIQTVSITSPIQPTSVSYWFFGCSNLTSLDLSNLDTSAVTDMSGMFSGCTGLTSLNLSGWNTRSVTNMSNMFSGCSNLKMIYASDSFTTTAVTGSTDMFSGCTFLVGGNGTQWSNEHTDLTYACIDGNSNQQGYFTAVYYKVDNDNETTILYLSPTKTDDSYQFVGGPYTSADSVPWNGSHASITNVVISDEIRPLYVSYWFFDCTSLTTLDLSSLNTSAVTDMSGMFSGCNSLTTIFVSDNSFVTDQVTASDDMFLNCTSLQGGNSTTYADGNPKDKTYARIDGGTDNPGYFTQEPEPTPTEPTGEP